MIKWPVTLIAYVGSFILVKIIEPYNTESFLWSYIFMLNVGYITGRIHQYIDDK